MPIRGFRCPYSLVRRLAVRNAVAVWPLGKECLLLPSGRMACLPCFKAVTVPQTRVVAMASAVIIWRFVLLASAPASLRVSSAAAGAYCR